MLSYAQSDTIAMGALSALGSKTWLHDISVMSFNNIQGARFYNPPITTVHLDTAYGTSCSQSFNDSFGKSKLCAIEDKIEDKNCRKILCS